MQAAAARPFVGREAVLREVLASVLRPGGHGAVVVADAGMGKSALAGILAQRLEGQIPVYRIHTSSSLSQVSYGALAPLISDVDPQDAGSPLAVMRALLRRLYPDREKSGPEAAPLLIVDDADALDEASADLLAQLIASAQIRILLLARRIADVPSGIPNQVWEGALTRHELQPLTEEQVHELCVQVLGGPVLTGTSTDLALAAGGNPMLTLALLAETTRAGTLAARNGVWLLHEHMLPPEGRLGDLLRAQLSGLTRDERDALELIALAEPLPASTAFELGLHRAVDALTEAKLVKISTGPSRLLQPMHPLYGDVVRRLVPAARSARLRQRLLTSGAAAGTADNLLRWVIWSLDCGDEVSDAKLVQAAYRANNAFDTAAALRAAGAVKGPEYALAARVQAARACHQDGDLGSARELIDGVTDAAADPTTLKMAVLIRAQLSRQEQSGVSGLRAVAADWLAGVDRIEAGGNLDAELTADLISSRRGGRLLNLMSRVGDGELQPAEDELSSILADARRAGDDEAILVAEAVLAEIYTATGRVAAASELGQDAMAVLDRGGHRFMSYYHFVLQRHVAALLWMGNWDALQTAAQHGTAGVFGALVRVAGMVDLALAVMHLRKDDAAAALTYLSASIEGLRTHDDEGMLPLALSLGAFVAATGGQRQQAEELLAEAGGMKPRGPAAYRLLARGYATATGAVLAMQRDAPKHLREIISEAQEAGFAAVELELRILALALGNMDGLGRLAKITEEFEGPQAQAAGRLARAFLDEDIDELLRFGAGKVEPGWRRVANRCCDEALRIARASGDKALLQRVQKLLNKKNGHSPSHTLHAGAPLLTRRERDIAALVIQGYRNAEIAERLFLSVRTVEGHIYRTFEKLGISRREDLKQGLLTGNSQG
ncbi:LuxR C-terminal-related transcriptional regulator [Arthrobacter sp. ATA002]|uniref:helix-turn-helix transcriptional regulator n=1 Tax=Arthrobacter sp. ATA002 TaxID=2991715 RepID=UPI0022A7BA99|nr:LuxR C-terminal-related transcriptional regulator [Arthrobacter sp. ATA002]WAP53419.1 LuxR C-terminal-related transcriptional regulator [Arthrobacter sp. ATA002]